MDLQASTEHSFTKAEAKYYAMRKSKDGIIISFVIHPADFSNDLALAPIGTRMLLAIAEIKDEADTANG